MAIEKQTRAEDTAEGTVVSDNEEKFREIFDNINDAIHIHEILDDGSPGRFVEVNEVACRMLQYTREELLQHGPLDFVTDYHSRPLADIVQELATRGSSLFETEHRKKDGTTIPVEVNAHVIQFGGKRRVLSVVRDITGRKRAEDKLKKSDERFRMMADWTYDMEYWIDQNKDVVYVSPSVERITGFSAGELIADKDLINRIVHPDDRALWEGHNQLHTQDMAGKTPLEVEFRINAKDGSMRWIGHTCRAIFADDGTWAGRRVSNRDITERKRAEEALRESERKYKNLVAMLNEGIWVIDQNATTTFVNRKMAEILGYTPDEMIGRPAYSFTPPELQEHAKQDIDAAQGDKPKQREIILLKKDGTNVYTLMETAEIRDASGKYLGGIADVIDITERKQMEKVVLASLKEKEILLKEIHHRVKNNLQIIASLLSLQSRYITDENVLSALKESQNRVKAMALVHERLYRSENLSEVALSDYLQFLVDNLFRFYGANPQKVRLAFDAGDVRVDINKAIPIGLIINELVSNSLKHAFPEGRKGELNISIRQDESALVLTVHDNGPGIPADFDWRNAKSLGLRLVISLVDQLNGTIELDRTAGTAFTIVVKEKQ